MDRIASKVTEEIRVFFEYVDFDTRSSKKEAEDHSRGSATNDAAADLPRLQG